MPETIEQYKQRIMSADLGNENPLKVQAATGSKLAKLLKKAARPKLRKAPAPGKWSITEILAHLADTELVTGYRIRSILGAPGSPLAAFDQDQWASAENYARHDPKMSLHVFRTLREANVALLKLLRPVQRKQYGVHAERGKDYRTNRADAGRSRHQSLAPAQNHSGPKPRARQC